MDAPLKGIRVIDWTIWQQGPVATAMLADMGAEVIKIEEREKGDPGRGVFAIGGAESTRALKRVADWCRRYRHQPVREQWVALKVKLLGAKPWAEEPDAGGKGVADRLGLGYKDLSAHNPKLVYASSSGYGPFGPDSGEPSFDYLAQARSGIMYTGPADIKDPIYLTGGIADQMGAIMLAYGVTMALVARERYGVGQEVNASHLGSMIALQGLNVASRTFLGHEFKRNAREESFNPLWNHYKCADEKWICLGMIQDRYWKDFCNAVGIPELIEDPRFNNMRARGKNRREVIAILDKVFATKPRDEWMHIMKHGGDFIYTVVNSINDLPTDPQVLANEYVVDYDHPELGKMQVVGVPVILSQTPGNPRGRAPELGENTELILTEMLGYSWDDIAKFREAGVI